LTLFVKEKRKRKKKLLCHYCAKKGKIWLFVIKKKEEKSMFYTVYLHFCEKKRGKINTPLMR
jgi:hypothetical protein